MNLEHPKAKATIENVSSYERQKVETTVRELRLAANTLQNALIMLDFAAEKGIPVADRTSMDWIRRDPDSPMLQGISQLARLAHDVQTKTAAQIPEGLRSELDARFIKSE